MKTFSYKDNVMIDKADQCEPAHLYKKIFKSKKDRQILDEFKDIVLHYYPDYTEKDIAKLYENLSREGCAYASLANTLVVQLDFDNDFFKEKFGFDLESSDGTVNYNKVMIDIYACLKDIVQLDVSYYEFLTGRTINEITQLVCEQQFENVDDAIVALFNNGWSGNGKDANDNLVFKSRTCQNRRIIGNYSAVANELFGIDRPGISKDELVELLQENKMEYKFSYESAPTKLSGLLSDKVQNFWVNRYLQEKNIDLTFESRVITSDDFETYDDFKMMLLNKRDEGSFISIATGPHSNVWMTDGDGLGWSKPSSDSKGHKMTFAGFDDEDNILVSTYGHVEMIPKEFYKQLNYTESRVQGYTQEKNSNLENTSVQGNKKK